MKKIKGLILFADGFEDSEGLVTRDLLMRGHLEITSISITNTKSVVTSHNLQLQADILLNDLILDMDNKLQAFQFLILPGGLLGVSNLKKNLKVLELIHYFMNHNKDVYAICAAPSILGYLGYLDNKPFTCFPGFEKNIAGIYTSDDITYTSEHIITAKSMECTVDFALAILKKWVNKETINTVIKNIKGL